MKFKSYTGITWSVLELTGLLEDEDSHVCLEKFKKHLGLHPFHLTNLTVALNEILSSNLNFYDTDLKGFVLAYKSPKLLTPLGEIVYDTCFIHVDIEADFYVFRPEVGSSLKGIVNKKGRDHIGVLVHKAFNISIPKPDNEEDWVGDNLEIGQEVRFAITLLDFTSKLPFIRGVLNPDDYLQGCKLTEKAVNKRNNKNVQNNVNKRSKKSSEQPNQHTFFANDSENTSEEDASQTKKKRAKQKKLNKELEEEVVKHSKKEKKDKKHAKKMKKLEDSESIDIETVPSEYTNGKFTDTEELEESVSSKSKFKRKSKSHSSQNYIDEDPNEESEKYSSQDTSERLSDMESKHKINKIKLKQHRTSKGSEWTVEDNTTKSKVEVEKNIKKGKDFDDSGHSTDDFSSYKYIQHSAKKNLKSSPTKTNIKMEELNDTNGIKSEIIKSPTKKRYMDFETSESDIDRKSKDILLKGKSKKSRTSDSKFTIENMKIKKERVTSGSENSEDEGYMKINKVSKVDSKLNTSAHNSNYDDSIQDDESDIEKKQKKHLKNKIKVKSEFKDVIVEKSDNENEDTYHKDNKSNLSKTNSPKKKHKVNVDNSIDSDEIDTKSNVKYSNKMKIKDRDMKIRNIKVEVESPESDSDNIIYSSQNHKEKLRHKKISNKSKHSESDFDFDNVQIKTEMFSDD